MKKTLLLLILIITSCCSVYSQKNKATSDTFDIKEYNQLKKRAVNTFETPDGATVVLTEDSNTYKQLKKIKNSNYSQLNIYYKKSLLLKSHVNLFQDFPIGLQEKYNESGELIDQKNWDEGYSFSISKLAEKMQSVFKIDILQFNNGVGVLRGSSDKANYYLVTIPLSPYKKGDHRLIKIDGISGEIISDKVSTYQDN